MARVKLVVREDRTWHRERRFPDIITVFKNGSCRPHKNDIFHFFSEIHTISTTIDRLVMIELLLYTISPVVGSTG